MCMKQCAPRDSLRHHYRGYCAASLDLWVLHDADSRSAGNYRFDRDDCQEDMEGATAQTSSQVKEESRGVGGGTAIGTVVVVLLGQPWMPSEQITTTSSGETAAGYVVGEQAGQLLLLDRSRKPVWIEVSDISKREVCEINWLPQTSLDYHSIFRAQGTPTPVECAKE